MTGIQDRKNQAAQEAFDMLDEVYEVMLRFSWHPSWQRQQVHSVRAYLSRRVRETIKEAPEAPRGWSVA